MDERRAGMIFWITGAILALVMFAMMTLIPTAACPLIPCRMAQATPLPIEPSYRKGSRDCPLCLGSGKNISIQGMVV
jgi:hypothetical protein